MSNLNSFFSCVLEIANWVGGYTDDAISQADVVYANAWTVENSANTAPPATISPLAQYAAGNYRIFNDYGSFTFSATDIGLTPDPCGTGTAAGPLLGGQPSPSYNGQTGNAGTTAGATYQIAEGRVGTEGQKASATLNGGRQVPWVWSIIEFDVNGNPTTTDHALFPTYSVYKNGVLQTTYPQTSVQNFIQNAPLPENSWAPIP